MPSLRTFWKPQRPWCSRNARSLDSTKAKHWAGYRYDKRCWEILSSTQRHHAILDLLQSVQRNASFSKAIDPTIVQTLAVNTSLIRNKHARKFEAGIFPFRRNFSKGKRRKRKVTQGDRKLATFNESGARRECNGLNVKLDSLYYSWLGGTR